MSKGDAVTKNDKAWSKLFEKYRILEAVDNHGYFIITAQQIKEFREPRLMAKFDHRINLPKLFSKNGLSILPISRGSYVIARIETYKDLEPVADEVTVVPFPEYIQSIDYENITSESMAINCAYVSGILADFLDDQELVPTVNGRMSSGTFQFQILNADVQSYLPINVENSQVEVDGGYEGINQLAIIEAKNFISEDFLIRQLYYPYRLWNDKITKKVTPVFLVYSNGIYTLYQYEFEIPEKYNSLSLIKQRNYSVEPVEISLDDIINVLKTTQIVSEPEIAFPQADDFRRVINLCELLEENEMTRDEITLNYAFDPRQTNYYSDAGRYLGLIEKQRIDGEITFYLTSLGKQTLKQKYKARQLRFVGIILRHKVFNETLRRTLEQGELISKDGIVRIMKDSDLYRVEAESTYYRRASTVSGWINWILSLSRAS